MPIKVSLSNANAFHYVKRVASLLAGSFGWHRIDLASYVDSTLLFVLVNYFPHTPIVTEQVAIAELQCDTPRTGIRDSLHKQGSHLTLTPFHANLSAMGSAGARSAAKRTRLGHYGAKKNMTNNQKQSYSL